MGQHLSSRRAPDPARRINRFYSHLGIYEPHKVLRLAYTDFPEGFSNLLPDIPRDQITDSICVCPTCAPALWSLPPTLEHPLHDPWSSLNRCCDFRRPLSHIHQHLASLGTNGSSFQATTAENLKRALDNLAAEDKVTVTQEEVFSLGTLLDRLFFGSCLNGVMYKAGTVGQDPGLIEKRTIGYSTFTPEYPDGLIFVDSTLNKDTTEDGLLSTLLHEMVHNFLARHLCKGEISAHHTEDDERAKLCRYMFSRFVYMFNHAIPSKAKHKGVGSKNKEDPNDAVVEIHMNSMYKGHGSLFQIVLEWIHKAVPNILGEKYPVAKLGNPSERKFKGEVSPTDCWSHHCDGYRHMQKQMWKHGNRKKVRVKSRVGQW